MTEALYTRIQIEPAYVTGCFLFGQTVATLFAKVVKEVLAPYLTLHALNSIRVPSLVSYGAWFKVFISI